MMKELNKIVAELNQHLAVKERELGTKANGGMLEQLENCRNDIEEFKASIKEVSKEDASKSEVIYNFRREADRLKLRIDKINR